MRDGNYEPSVSAIIKENTRVPKHRRNTQEIHPSSLQCGCRFDKGLSEGPLKALKRYLTGMIYTLEFNILE